MAPPPPSNFAGGADEAELNVVDTPTSPSAGFALARFEFESDKGNEGTKILMVEWDGAAAATTTATTTTTTTTVGETKGLATAAAESGPLGDWEVSWEGKTTVLPIRDSDATSGANRRVYFLLPPGAPIPPLVSISKASGAVTLRTKPLPAIFPEGLGANKRETGSRGVLHTLWAKQRLQELEDEIVAEMKANGESVGLEMIAQERDWIVKHFGLSIDTSSAGAIPLGASGPMTPSSPRSPIGGRLGEKLKGLKLATSPAELAAAKEASKTPKKPRQITSFAPEAGDVTVSSFSTFPGRMAGSAGGVASLDAVVETDTLGAAKQEVPDTEEDLFALPMSPRSPEMAKSPFSML